MVSRKRNKGKERRALKAEKERVAKVDVIQKLAVRFVHEEAAKVDNAEKNSFGSEDISSDEAEDVDTGAKMATLARTRRGHYPSFSWNCKHGLAPSIRSQPHGFATRSLLNTTSYTGDSVFFVRVMPSLSPCMHWLQHSNSRKRSMIQCGMIERNKLGLSHSFWQLARNISSMEKTVVLATALSYPTLSSSALQWASIDLEPHSTCQSYVSF